MRVSEPFHPPRLLATASWLLLLLPLLVLLLLYRQAGPIAADIGTPADTPLLEHFYGIEQHPSGNFRWSEERAAFILPLNSTPAVLRIRAATPPGSQVSLLLTPAARVDLPVSAVAQVRNYHLLWPTAADPLGWARVHIAAESTPDAERQLGLAIFDRRVEPLAGNHLPPWLPLALLGLTPLALAGTFHRLLPSAQHIPATVSAALLGLFPVLVWIQQPLAVRPYTVMIFVLAVAGYGLAGLLRWLRSNPTPIDARHLLALFVAGSGLILVKGFVFHGSYWLFQWWQLPVPASLLAMLLPAAGIRLRQGLIAAIVLILGGYAWLNYSHAMSYYRTDDFDILFGGVQSFFQGGSLYNLAGVQTNHLGDASYKYPPLLAAIMAPLADLPLRTAAGYWRWGSLALLLLSALLLWRWSGRPWHSWSTLGLVYIIVTLKPLADSLRYGQVDMILIFGMSAALLALRHERWAAWGAALALPAMLKVYPGYLLLHALALRRWRGGLGFAVGAAAITLLSLLILSPGVYLIFARDVAPVIGGGTAWIENQTINGFLNRLLVDEVRLHPDQPGPIHWLTYAGAALVTLLTALAARRMPAAAGFGLWIVAMLFILPAGWIHYQTVLLIPFYQLLVRAESKPGSVSRPALLLYGLAWFLLCFGDQWTFLNRDVGGPAWELLARGDFSALAALLLMSYKFYGLILLWGTIALDHSARLAALPAQEQLRTRPATV
jgi:hypothetical protein